MWAEKIKKENKKKYLVDVFEIGLNFGEPFRNKIKTVETFAVSKSKAESNARYRTEGKAYHYEPYGSDAFCRWYEYEARLA